METKLEHFKSGIIQELPLQIGVFPFGLIYGILAVESGLSVLQSFFMSSIIFVEIGCINLSPLFVKSFWFLSRLFRFLKRPK